MPAIVKQSSADRASQSWRAAGASLACLRFNAAKPIKPRVKISTVADSGIAVGLPPEGALKPTLPKSLKVLPVP